MSNIVSALVQKRKVGSPTRKAILMFMASCASDDGSGVWTSKATMARDLEMGKRTVQVSIDDLASMGLISEDGTRRCPHGFTVEYRLNLDAISRLDATHPGEAKGQSKPLESEPEATGAGDAPVQDVHPTRAGDAPQDVQEMHPNHPRTIHEPPSREGAREAADSDFEKVWSAYPSDRRRGKCTCQEQFVRALDQGVSADDIAAAARAYARESEGFTRSKVCYSDNWFREQRWQRWLEARTAEAEAKPDMAAFWAERINAGKRIFGNPISPALAREMIERGLCEPDRLKAQGVAA